MATVQTDRIITIDTPKGGDYLLVESFTVEEAISDIYSIKVELLHQEDSPEGTVPTIINPSQLLGQPMSIKVDQRDVDTIRHFHGIVRSFSQGGRDGLYTSYQVELVPQLWLLTQRRQSRIFQQINVPDVLRKVFSGMDVQYEIRGTYKPRNYCVQYRETDFNFASRLMEEEGIYYYFRHFADKHTLVVADTPQSHQPVEPAIIPFVLEIEGESNKNAILAWDSDHYMQTGKVTYWDHNFQMHTKKLEAVKDTIYKHGGNDKLEVYDFPGYYAQRFDGIDPGGGERSSDLQNIYEDNKRAAAIAMEGLDSRFTQIAASGTSAAISAGSRFTLSNHQAANGDYVITSVRHSVSQSPGYRAETVPDTPFTNEFTCIPYGRIPTTDKPAPPFRPERKAQKPVVTGSQTAMVVGPPGEEIFTDKYGRIKVQFHWDRDGKYDQSSSCWVRVAQSWAGNNWGTMFIPRIGMEAVVSFLEGDPDQPIVTGCVYNPMSMPPYKLPDHKTRSVIKTNSSKGGGGFNEVRFEDKKGSEQIFIHAEKNKDLRVKNDLMETIERDRHLLIKRDQIEKVDKDKHLKVKGDHSEDVGGKIGIRAGSNMEMKAGSKIAAEAGSEVHIKAGATAVIEAGASLTLKVGGNSVAINSGGVFIKGTMVHLNSMAAAVSGSGSNPAEPKEPTEAEKADAGSAMAQSTPTQPPARPPLAYDKLAVQARASAAAPPAPAGPAPAPKTEAAEIEEVKDRLDSITPSWSRTDLAALVLPKLAGEDRKELQEILKMDHAVTKVHRLMELTEKALDEAKQEAAAAQQQASALASQAVSKYQEVKEEIAEQQANYQEFKEDVDNEIAEQKQNYQEFKEELDEQAANYEELKEEIGEQAAAMIDAAKDGVPYIPFTG